METNFQKIQRLLFLSDLPEQEQDKFLILISGTADEELEPLATLFTEDPNWIRKINENFRAKETAFAEKNKSEWAKILKEEEILLQDVGNEK